MEPPDGDDRRRGRGRARAPGPGLSLPLYRATDGTDIVAEWQSWARVLELPLLVAEPDGGLREPFARIGAVRVGTVARTAAQAHGTAQRGGRRCRCGGAPVSMPATPVVHRDEREIIARN